MIIASYPRSGSTYLKLLLTNLYYEGEHDVRSANRHIPTLESEKEILEGIDNPIFYKTHEKRCNKDVIFLHRHVGDCLVSEYNYHKDYYDYDKDIETWLESNEYGKGWREMVDFYYPCLDISFEQLTKDPFNTLYKVYAFSYTPVKDSRFNEVDYKTFKDLNNQDPTFFRSGKTGQWKKLPQEIQDKIINFNKKQLKLLGYGKEKKSGS